MHMKAADKAELELLFGHLKEGGDEVDIKDGDNRLANHHIDMYMWLCRRDLGMGDFMCYMLGTIQPSRHPDTC